MPGENKISVTEPSTVYISFGANMPKLFAISNINTGVGEYFRYTDGKTPRIKFNVPIPGDYATNVPVTITKIVSIEIPTNLPVLPTAQRDRLKGDPTVIYDPGWTTSPASNFTQENLIVHGPVWKGLIPPMRLFIDLHEVGHFFYLDEDKCDLYALVNFLRMGYNKSTAYYALSNILRRTPQAVDRMKKLFTAISKADGPFQPE